MFVVLTLFRIIAKSYYEKTMKLTSTFNKLRLLLISLLAVVSMRGYAQAENLLSLDTVSVENNLHTFENFLSNTSFS